MAGIEGNQYPQDVLQKAIGPAREKTWEECANEERLERLRQEVRSLAHAIEGLLRNVNTLNAHQHADNGDILVRAYFGGGIQGESPSRWRDRLA